MVRRATAVVGAQPCVDPAHLARSLASAEGWNELQAVAVQHQGRLDQAGVVAVMQRAELLAAATREATPADQYACARVIESACMSAAPLVPTMSAPAVAMLLGSFGSLVAAGMVVRRYVPYMLIALVQALILASINQLRTYSAAQLVSVLRSCTLLSPSGVPDVWLAQWQAAAAPGLRGLGPEALLGVMSSLAILRQRQGWSPAAMWLQDCLEAVQARLSECTSHQLREFMVSLAGMELRPADPWVGAFRKALDRHVAAGMQPADLAGVLYACQKLKVEYV